ncbi:MAG: AAA family ATPase [Promethearchaeota archaeon]
MRKYQGSFKKERGVRLIENLVRPIKVAIVGKGGVGKTVIVVLLAKVISKDYNYKLLLIDADPTHPHLCNMLKIKPKKTLEELRLDAIKNAHIAKQNPQKLAEKIDFDIYEGMAESKDFCIFSMGQPEGPGCFCPSNILLRRVIESISQDFDLILIDAEAGLEQINRKVFASIDILLIITDSSLRSLETANSIKNHAKKFTNYKRIGVIINKANENIEFLVEKLKELNLPLIGTIPVDNIVSEFDLHGNPLIDLPDNSKSLKSIRILIKDILPF